MDLLTKILLGLFVLFLTACQTSGTASNLKEAEVQDLSTATGEVQIKTEKDTYPSTIDKIVLLVTNNSDEGLGGASFELEKAFEGTWYKFPMKDSGPINAIGGYQSPHATSQLTLSTEELQYELSPGSYRATFMGMASEFTVTE